MNICLDVSSWVLLAQEGGGDFASSFFNNPLPLIVGLMLMFYFIVIAPERRRKSELEQQLTKLKKNDEVVLQSGIIGRVANVQQGSDRVTLRLDESSGAKMTVLRSAIMRILNAEESIDKKTAADKSADK